MYRVGLSLLMTAHVVYASFLLYSTSRLVFRYSADVYNYFIASTSALSTRTCSVAI